MGWRWVTNSRVLPKREAFFLIKASLCRWRGSQSHSSAWGHDVAICRPSMQHWLKGCLCWQQRQQNTDIWPQKYIFLQERQMETLSLVRCRLIKCFYSTTTKVFQICRPLRGTHVWLKTRPERSKVQRWPLTGTCFYSSFKQRIQNLQPFTLSSSNK